MILKPVVAGSTSNAPDRLVPLTPPAHVPLDLIEDDIALMVHAGVVRIISPTQYVNDLYVGLDLAVGEVEG